MEIPAEAVQAVAEDLHRAYDSEYGADHLTWEHFAERARELIEVAAPFLGAHIAALIRAQKPKGNTPLTFESGIRRAAKVAKEAFPKRAGNEREFENPPSAPSEPPLAGDGAPARYVGSSGHPAGSESPSSVRRDVGLPDYITIDPNNGALGETGAAHWACGPHRHTGTWIGQENNEVAARREAVAHLDELHPDWRMP